MRIRSLVIMFSSLFVATSYGQDLNFFRTFTPVIFEDSQGRTITIRNIEENEFDAVKTLATDSFAQAYGFTTQEKIDGLKKVYDVLMVEEIAFFRANHATMISLVAICNDKIIGYFSAHLLDMPLQMYGRFLVIDPEFQRFGVAERLLKCCSEFLPSLKKVVCLTSKKNPVAQKFYEHLGGKKVENPSWMKYLYSNLNTSGYIGYEFDEAALAAFNNR